MGQTHALSSFETNNELPDLSSYNLLYDNRYGDILMRDLKKDFIIKEFTYPDKKSFDRAFNYFSEMKKNQNKNLVSMRSYKEISTKSICGELYKLYVEFEFINSDLATLIRKKRLRNEYFKETEILNFVSDAIKICSFFQKKQISLRNLKSRSFLFDVNGVYKILDPFFFVNQSNFSNFLVSDERNEKKFTYVSPEELDSLKFGVNDKLHDSFKSDVFILGIVVLEMSQLKSCDQFYDMNIYELNKNLLIQMLQSLENKFPSIFLILNQMLEIDYNKRKDFIELEKLIQQKRKKQINDENQMKLASSLQPKINIDQSLLNIFNVYKKYFSRFV